MKNKNKGVFFFYFSRFMQEWVCLFPSYHELYIKRSLVLILVDLEMSRNLWNLECVSSCVSPLLIL